MEGIVMKRLLLMIVLGTSLSVAAQDKELKFASVPLGKKSVGKHFDRAKLAAVVPEINLEGKYILVDVFFQACGPCLKSIPYLNKLADTTVYPQLRVISVDPFPEDSASMEKFISDFKIQYTVVAGTPAVDIWSLVGNNGFPFAFLIDPFGKIIAIESGFSKDGFEELQEKLKS